MAQFRFETEVETTVVFEYFIDADSLEEALSQLKNGEHRDRGSIIRDNQQWETEIITVEEQFD